MLLDTRNRLECTIRRGKLLAIIILLPFPAAAVSGLMGWQMAAHVGKTIGISFGIFIASAMLLFWLRCWYDMVFRKVVLIIDEVGIEDRRNGFGIIAWEDISYVSTVQGRDEPNIVIRVKDEAKHVSILPIHRKFWIRLRSLTRIDPFLIDCFALTPGFDSIYKCIRAHFDFVRSSGK